MRNLSLTIGLACSVMLLSNASVCAQIHQWPEPPNTARKTSAIVHAISASEPPADPYAAWKERVLRAKEELERLRAELHKTEEQKIVMLRQLWYQWGFVDDAAFANTLARIRELNQQILNKKDELATTIPDEARRAGIPPRVVSP